MGRSAVCLNGSVLINRQVCTAFLIRIVCTCGLFSLHGRAHGPTITARILASICDEIARLRSRLPHGKERAPCRSSDAASSTKKPSNNVWPKKRFDLRRLLKNYLPVVMPRNCFCGRARQAETAAHIDEWLTSPGLQPPKALADLLADQK